jgi:integrase
MITGGLQKRGNIWYAVYRQSGRQVWKSTKCTRESDAILALRDLIAPLNAGDQARAYRKAADDAYERKGQLIGRSLRVSEIWEKFQKSPERLDASPATMKGYRAQLKKFEDWLARAYPKCTAMADVDDSISRSYAEWLAGETGSPTYNNHIGLLKMCWKIVNRSTGWKENPWTAISKKKSVSVSKRDLTWEEIQRLLQADTGEWKTLITIGIYTALRLADAATLKWEEVDLDLRKIVRAPRKTIRRTGRPVTIPIFPDLHQILSDIKAKLPKKEAYVLPTLARRYERNRSSLCHHIARIFNRAKIQRMTDDIKPGRLNNSVSAGFHSLRHSFVSLCRTGNVPEAVVMSIVGHGSPAMTRHYTHIGEDTARAAMVALPHLGDATVKRVEAIPEAIAQDLRRMTAKNWKEIRDSMLAGQAEVVTIALKEPRKIAYLPKK